MTCQQIGARHATFLTAIAWLLFLLLSTPCTNRSLAQSTSDSLVILHSPVKATLLSTALPGAGQYYNKKYWKIPVIYGALAGLGYLVKFNHDKFETYQDAFIKRTDNDPSTVDEFTDSYSDSDLERIIDLIGDE